MPEANYTLSIQIALAPLGHYCTLALFWGTSIQQEAEQSLCGNLCVMGEAHVDPGDRQTVSEMQMPLGSVSRTHPISYMPAQKRSDAEKGTVAADFNPKSLHEKEVLDHSRKYQLTAASWTSKQNIEPGQSPVPW